MGLRGQKFIAPRRKFALLLNADGTEGAEFQPDPSLLELLALRPEMSSTMRHFAIVVMHVARDSKTAETLTIQTFKTS